MGYSSQKEEALNWVLEKLSAKGKSPKPTLGIPPLPKIAPLPALPTQPLSPLEKKKELTSKKQTEITLWKDWNDGGRKPKDLDPLLRSMQPLIESHAQKYKNKVEIPNAAIDFEHKRLAVEALEKYNPGKGAALGTWMSNYLRKANRFILAHQNFARITEPVAAKIGKFNSAKAELTEQLGFEPDTHTLSEHTGFSVKEIKRITKDQRKGLVSSGLSGTEVTPAAMLSSREQEVVQLIYHQLTPQERSVHEYTFGLYGKPVLKPGAIAKKLNLDSSKIAKLRTSIFNKMKPHLE